MQELDQRRNALLHDLHELKSSATSRLDSVTRQRHLDTMKHQVAVAVANAQKALDQLEAVLSSTSPPSSEGSSIIEELNGTRHSAEAAIGSAEQTLNDCRYQSKSLKEDSIALFNSMISEEEEHLRTQGDRSKHLYQRIDAIRLHSDDLAIAQEKHAAGATTVSPLKAEQVKQDCQDRVASVDSVQTSVEDRLHALAENLTALEDGVEHIQKQQRVKKQTNVLSRSLSASASSLGALSQSISEDLTQTERLISRSKHAGVLAPPGAFHLTSQLKTSTARHQEAAKQLYSTTQLGESSPDCKDLTCAPDPSTAGENSHLATDVFGSRTVWTDDIVVRWQERFAEFAELIADLEEVLKSGKCIEERDAEDLRKQIEELEEDIPPTTHYDVNHATVQGLLACVEKMGTVNHFLEKKKAADHASVFLSLLYLDPLIIVR